MATRVTDDGIGMAPLSDDSDDDAPLIKWEKVFPWLIVTLVVGAILIIPGLSDGGGWIVLYALVFVPSVAFTYIGWSDYREEGPFADRSNEVKGLILTVSATLFSGWAMLATIEGVPPIPWLVGAILTAAISVFCWKMMED